ncbi:MAG: hypothetical protein ACKO46_00830, partial [Alphaproteobacteria bacterium]
GYTGSISYNCNAQNTPNLSGTCTASGGSYTPDWYGSWQTPGGGALVTQPTSVGLRGPNGVSGNQWGFLLTYLPAWVTKVTFRWDYLARDYGTYDSGYYFANGGWNLLAYNQTSCANSCSSCTNCAGGATITVNINPGGDRRFGPGVYTVDGCCGAMDLTFSNIVFQ